MPLASASPKPRGVGASSRSPRRRSRSAASRQWPGAPSPGGAPAGLLLLADVPPHRSRRLQPAFDAVLAIGAERLVLAEHDILRLIHHAVGNGERDRLLLVGVGLAGKGRAQLLHVGVARPAEPRLVAGAGGEGIACDIVGIGSDGRGEEGVPAALVGWLLAGAPRHDGLPIRRYHVDLEAGFL